MYLVRVFHVDWFRFLFLVSYQFSSPVGWLNTRPMQPTGCPESSRINTPGEQTSVLSGMASRTIAETMKTAPPTISGKPSTAPVVWTITGNPSTLPVFCVLTDTRATSPLGAMVVSVLDAAPSEPRTRIACGVRLTNFNLVFFCMGETIHAKGLRERKIVKKLSERKACSEIAVPMRAYYPVDTGVVDAPRVGVVVGVIGYLLGGQSVSVFV